jgi:succinoglycan biosynthesis protein ExoV
MKLHYYRDPRGNFGDDLNPWLWGRLLPELLDSNPDELLLGIGTIINNRVPSTPHKHVLGSGVGYGSVPVLDSSWDIRFVRGPLSCEALGLKCDVGICDPAVLVSRYLRRTDPGGPVSVMPHHLSQRYLNWADVCARSGFQFISPTGTVEAVLDAIARSSLVISEAMHGAIVADALRIPWIPVRIYPQFLPFKWLDWMGSLGLESEIHSLEPQYDGSERSFAARLKGRLAGRLPSPERARKRMAAQLTEVARRDPVLSQESRLEAAVDAMGCAIERFRQEQDRGARLTPE